MVDRGVRLRLTRSNNRSSGLLKSCFRALSSSASVVETKRTAGSITSMFPRASRFVEPEKKVSPLCWLSTTSGRSLAQRDGNIATLKSYVKRISKHKISYVNGSSC